MIFSTVHIVGIDVNDGKEVDAKVKLIMLILVVNSTIDLLAIQQKSLDRALFLYIFKPGFH